MTSRWYKAGSGDGEGFPALLRTLLFLTSLAVVSAPATLLD